MGRDHSENEDRNIGLDHRVGHGRDFFPCRKNSLSLKQLAAWKKIPAMA